MLNFELHAVVFTVIFGDKVVVGAAVGVVVVGVVVVVVLPATSCTKSTIRNSEIFSLQMLTELEVLTWLGSG